MYLVIVLLFVGVNAFFFSSERKERMLTYHFVEDELRDGRSPLGPTLLKSLDAQSNAKELPIGLRNGLVD